MINYLYRVFPKKFTSDAINDFIIMILKNIKLMDRNQS